MGEKKSEKQKRLMWGEKKVTVPREKTAGDAYRAERNKGRGNRAGEPPVGRKRGLQKKTWHRVQRKRGSRVQKQRGKNAAKLQAPAKECVTDRQKEGGDICLKNKGFKGRPGRGATNPGVNKGSQNWG